MIYSSFRLKGEILQRMNVHKIPRPFASRNDTKHIFSKISINQKGFTLIEITTSLIIVMIISVIAGMGLIEIARGYVYFKKNSIIAQQGQIAMARLKKEISNIQSVTSGTATSITFTRSPGGGSPITIFWAGGNSPLLIDGDTLIGPVISFNMAYYEFDPSSTESFKFKKITSCSSKTSIIEITIQLLGAEDAIIEFKDRVNLYLETGG